MEPTNNGHQDNHQDGQGFKPLPASSSNGIENTPIDRLAVSGVMELVLEITQTSAEIYELVADLAGSMVQRPQGLSSSGNPMFQGHLATLIEIVSATQKSELRVQRLESQVIADQPEILDGFLEDCWAVLTIFKEVGKSIGEIIDPDERTPPTETAAETLTRIMERLDTCAANVTGLPEKGMAVTHRCLVENALDLQRHAGNLVGRSTGAI